MQAQTNILKCDIIVDYTPNGQCRYNSDKMIDKIIISMPKIIFKTFSLTWRVFKVLVLGMTEEGSYNGPGSEYPGYKPVIFRRVI